MTSTTIDLVYDLCPHSRYFALPIPEQASVMHVLLRKLIDLETAHAHTITGFELAARILQ